MSPGLGNRKRTFPDTLSVKIPNQWDFRVSHALEALTLSFHVDNCGMRKKAGSKVTSYKKTLCWGQPSG